MASKRFRLGLSVILLFLFVTPMVVPNVFGLSYSLRPVPIRTMETSNNAATAVDLVLNVSQASIGTTYQFTWTVTDPSGTVKNANNQTVATSTSFTLSLKYPSAFGVNNALTLPGNYSVAVNQNMPAGATNPVATSQFRVGLTDKLVYVRTDTVVVSAAGYGNGESVRLNFTRGSTFYTQSVKANSTGYLSDSWKIPLNAPLGVWTVLLTGASTRKAVPDQQTFTVNPLNVTLSPLSNSPATVQRTDRETISFTANYQGGAVVQTGSANVELTEPDGVTSFYATATYNSTLAAFKADYTVPVNSQTGVWSAAVDPGMFNDSLGNTGPPASITAPFTVWPTNVTISQLAVGQTTLQRTQTQSLSFAANYLNGQIVQTGSDSIQLIESDGTTSIQTTATYNSTAGLFQSKVQIPANAETGAWLASVNTDSFNDGYGNGGPLSSAARAFSVQPATLTIVASIPNQTYAVGQVVPIYATVTYLNGTMMTTGSVTVSFTESGNRTGKPVILAYVQGQSRWAGSYVVGSGDLSGLWVASVNAGDSYGNSGQQTESLVVSVPPVATPASNPFSVDLYWFLVAVLIVGVGGSGFLLLRRSNMADGPFDNLYGMIGGEIPPATTVMITGEAGSGTTTLGLELIQKQLSAGRAAGLLAYDAFPLEIQRSMRSFGWDVSDNLKNGSFKILDCYSALAGVENSLIRDPVDFTEISIRVSQMMEDTGKGPYLLVFDSLAPVFNGVKAETTINFLRVLSAKIKNNNGILVLLGSSGAIPQQVKPSLDNIVDSVIELNMLRNGGKIIRTLTVKRMSGRKASPVPTEFKIVSGKGILFKTPRIPLNVLTPHRKAS